MSKPNGPGSPFATLFDDDASAGLSLPEAFQAIYGGDWRLPTPSAGRPYVYVNFAVSRDGRISFDMPGHMGGGDISRHNRHDQWLMDLLRARADAVLVGAATLRVDTQHVWTTGQIFPPDAAAFMALRQAEGRSPAPLHVFLSGSGNLAPDVAAFQRAGVRSVVATTAAGAERARKVLPRTGQVAILDLGAQQVDLAALLRALRDDYSVATLLCEGGGRVYGSLIQAGLVDDEFLTLCPIVVGSPPGGPPRPALVDGVAFAPGAAPRLRTISLRRSGDYLFMRSRYAS
jgi:riboflavin biosynthesis pyrimidine reductase